MKNLTQTVSKIVDRETKKANNELKQVDKDHQARKAGGFWDKIVEGPVNDYQKGIEEAGGQAREISNGKQGLLNQFSQYLDMGQTYAGMATELVSGITSNVMDEIGVINQITEAAGLGSIVPTSESMSCDPNLLVATVGSVVRIAGRVVDGALQSVFTVQATMGLAFDVIPDLYAGLLNQPVGTLSILLTNRESIFSGIEGLLQKVVALVPSITDDDYPFDHRSFVLGVQAELEKADSDLGRVEQTLESGGNFLEDLWNSSEDTVSEMAMQLLGVGEQALIPGFFNGRLMRLLFLERELTAFIQILNQRQAAFSALLSAIGSFKAEFESNAKFESLMAPLVQQVRCRLKVIIDDMGPTIQVNNILRYFVKEKQWGTELWMIGRFMQGAGRVGSTLQQPTTGLNDVADELTGAVKSEQESLETAESFNLLVSLLTSFLALIKRKIAGNIDNQAFYDLKSAIENEINILRQSDSKISELVGAFGSAMGSQGASVLSAVAMLYNFMEETGLDQMLDALKRGDWKNFFSADALKSSLERTASQALGDVIQCCVENAGNGDTEKRLLNMNRTVAAMQRGKEVFDRFTGGYAIQHIRKTTKKTLPNLQKLKADTQKVSRSNCVNKGQPTSGQSLGLTLV